MFHLHYDTDLDRLADALAALLVRRDPACLLQPQTVLVPQAGLQRWLVQRLAERHGIAANLEFIAPAQLTWRLLRAANPGLPAQSAFDREVMRWRLLDLLQHLPHQHPTLATLVEGEPAALRRFQLATHLAALFERYQAYRRDLLEAWERGDEAGDAQAELWRALTSGSTQPSRSRLLGDFLRRHAGDDAPPPAAVSARLFAFGCINVSPDVLRLLGTLGRHSELHFFLPTPCREYWGDLPRRRDLRAQLGEFGGTAFDQPANPLLVSMGGVGRDFVAQVFGYDEVQPDIETGADDSDPPTATLLQRVQADVVTLNAPAPHGRLPQPDPADISLQVHVCHSPLREVQVLHDRLLDLFQNDPALEPRDVAVMVPDIGAYAPCVDAVFGALAADDPRRIPWTVADRPAGDAHAITALFLRLLDLPASRLGVDEVLDALAVPAVLRNCGLDGADLEYLRGIAVAAGIRWGEDEHDRAAHGLPAYREFSWAFGRERLLLGYLLGDDEDDEGALVEAIAPLPDIEGERAVMLGQLLRVQRLLRQLRERQRVPRSATAWQRLLNRALDAMIPDSDERDEQRALEDLRAALAALGGCANAAGYDATLDWMCVREFLREHLQQALPHQRFLAGGVSVCGMIPLRNVPFKVICVLGLDAQAFPRRDPADALSRLYADALAGHRRPGDRSLRDDDRYLFLQTLMAARQVLYLSYTGIDLRDGNAREPSVLLAELLDTVCDGYFEDAQAARAALVTVHPMQPFSRRLFDGSDARVFTYRREWQGAAATAPGSRELPVFADVAWAPNAAPERIELAQLQHFFGAPQRYFLQRRVGLAIGDLEQQSPDREPLTDDSMTRVVRDRHLLDDLLRHTDTTDVPAQVARLRAQGLLPPLALGDQLHAESMKEMLPQARIWRRWAGGEAQPAQPFMLALPSGRVIEGPLPGLYAGGYGGWIGGANSPRRWMQWWLPALVVRALQGDVSCVAFGRDSKQLMMPRAPRMPSAQGATTLLEELLDIFAEGQAAPLLLPPRSGWTYVATGVASERPERALDAARSIWMGGRSFVDGSERSGECADPWIGTALRGVPLFVDDATTERFGELAYSVYGPLWLALHEGKRPA